jgi:hypothetical protein
MRFCERAIVGLASRFHADVGDHGTRAPLPVGIQGPHARVGEEQSEKVPLPLGDLAEVDHQSGCQRIPGEDVVRGRHDESPAYR